VIQLLKALSVVGGLLLLGMGMSCVPEAPHSNPIDPYYSGKQPVGVLLSGTVLTRYEPHVPIADCQVSLFPEQLFARTDSRGAFSFRLQQSGEHRILVSKEGFFPDTLLVNPDTLGGNSLNIYLNGQPYLVRTQVYSEYIDQWWPEPVTTINFRVVAADPDGVNDLDSITVVVPELEIRRAMGATARADSFSLTLTEDDFPDSNPFALIGKAIYFVLRDRSARQVSSGPHYLFRILEQSPRAIEPTSLQQVSPTPTFRWEPYPASFAFQYEVQVFFIQGGIPISIHRVTGIPPEQLEYQYPDSLPTGTYFWTIGVRDNLNNFSRSKEASFVVP
jgi:hypothetical protein